ncbi:hypothetical protein C8J57DRAFT_1478615 [Mycena rebaudengoi]|nr:hypothetical protein C8J57DRAFT_1478615 [Mycena rebaudengoi]
MTASCLCLEMLSISVGSITLAVQSSPSFFPSHLHPSPFAMHFRQFFQLLLFSFLPFSSFISASPVPQHHPDPEANAAISHHAKRPVIIITPGGNRDVSSKAASIITSTGFLKLASEPSPEGGVGSGGTGIRGLTAYSGDAYTNESRDSEDESITFLSPDSVTLNTRTSSDITQSGSRNPSRRIVGGTNAIEASVTSIEYRRDDWEQPVSGIAEARELVKRPVVNPTLNPSRFSGSMAPTRGIRLRLLMALTSEIRRQLSEFAFICSNFTRFAVRREDVLIYVLSQQSERQADRHFSSADRIPIVDDDGIFTRAQQSMFLRMLDHPEPAVAAGMTKRLEKRWNDCDQPLFSLTLILNPFEQLSCFGPKAGLNHFNCLDLIISDSCILLMKVKMYQRMKSRPDNTDTPIERSAKEDKLSCTGTFADWEGHATGFENRMGRDAIAVWVALSTPDIEELAQFAILLLKIVVNQAGLKLQKLDKMTKIGADIKADQRERGLIKLRDRWKVHKSTDALLTVPRYRDLFQDQDADLTEREPAVISAAEGWRTVMGKWIAEARAAEAEGAENGSADDNDENDEEIPAHTGTSRWKKKTLTQLFGASTKKPAQRLSQDEIEAEAVLMMA